jgi:peptide chain release factor 2
MQLSDLKNIIKMHLYKQKELHQLIDMASLKKDIDTNQKKTYDADFWNDPNAANKTIQTIKRLKKKYDKIALYDELIEELVMSEELVELDDSLLADVEEIHKQLLSQEASLEIMLLLSGEHDELNAILEIHPGAGGTESQDWADMLYRMYTRYAKEHDYQIDVLDYQAGDEAGIKSVTFGVKGDNAYGYLKAEHGVHRLVRISPFDSGGRRHTSFASITVIPEFDSDIDIDIDENDLKIDTYRSSGAGGQSVNTTDSAVRITHIPSHIVVTVQNERSQIKNRDKAMQILKGKLYQKALEEQQENISKYRATDVSNSFGSQIRSYVMHPYSMVKDHRTNVETGNVAGVMDGDLDPFIRGYLTDLSKGDLDG